MSDAPPYRVRANGCAVEVFDDRIVLLRIGPTPSLSDEVARLAQLRDRGVLSDDEFTAAKRRLIRSSTA